MSGILYIVATPIGNLDDITIRAIKILKEAEIILAEDTRVTGKLLNSQNFGVNGKYINLISYHQHSSDAKKTEILKYLVDGKTVALVTDAGTPGISDPANELITFILDKDPKIKIVPVPGASALITALSVSGLNVNKFVFLGFMPKKKKMKLFEWLKLGKMPFSYYDSPYRVIKNLQEVEKVFGQDTFVFVARELTKIYETLYRGKIKDVISQLEQGTLKGEVVVVVYTS